MRKVSYNYLRLFHLKLPTRPGEELADALYNTVRDFFPTMGAT